jgi:hypothetical protein
MAKITSNQYVKVLWIPDAAMTPAQAVAPPLSILTGGSAQDLSPAIAWSDFSLSPEASDTTTDRGITDSGNTQGRGFQNFSGTLSFFRDLNPGDTSSDYVKAFATFKTPRTYGYLVSRVASKKWNSPIVAGDRVNVYKFIADIITDDVDGDDSVKFRVSFLQQGVMYPYTIVSNTTPDTIAGVATTNTRTVAAGPYVLAPTLSGSDVRALSTYVSSNSSVATVSANGVVKPIAAGTTNITVTTPGAAAPVVQALTVS